MRYPTVRLLPDFRPSAFIMSAPVGVVIVLVGIEILSGRGVKQLARLELRAVAALAGIGFDDPGAIAMQNMFTLCARIARQTEGDTVAQRRAEHGQGNPGVATGRVENRLSLIEKAAPLGIENHRQGWTILDRTTWIEIFGLGQDFDAGRQRPTDAQQTN